MLKLFINATSYTRRLAIMGVITLILQGCSTTAGTANKANQPLSKTEQAFYQQALSDFKSGKIKSAEIKFKKFILKNPRVENAYINLAIIYLNQDNLKQAEDNLADALKINPENVYALNYMGITQRKKGNFDEARKLYQKALSVKPDYAYAHLNIGILYDLYFYDLSNAIEHYQKYQELTGDRDEKVKKWIIDLKRRLKNTVASK